jgi:outer membrane receptor for ferrienterochelin and colicins
MEAGTPSAVQEHNMYSLFAEDTWYVIKPLAITAGLRYDNHEVFGDQISPRLYAVYTVSDQWTVKGGVSTGFKTPKTTQLYNGITGFGGQGTTPLFGNPDLQPETSTSTELAAYWHHPDGHNFNATVFRNEFDDKLSTESCGVGLVLACPTGEYADLGYVNGNMPINIDEAVVQGAELAGRWQISDRFGFRANYTFTDSEQKSGPSKGLPLGNSARHMANATLDWQATDSFSAFLSAEIRSKRYRGIDANTGDELYWKDYEVLHLGVSYKISQWATINARINNLLDRDFTSYQYSFIDDGDGSYTLSAQDDYNNKDKARNVWVSLNLSF